MDLVQSHPSLSFPGSTSPILSSAVDVDRFTTPSLFWPVCFDASWLINRTRKHTVPRTAIGNWSIATCRWKDVEEKEASQNAPLEASEGNVIIGWLHSSSSGANGLLLPLLQLSR